MQSFVRPSGLFAILFFSLFVCGAFAADNERIVAPQKPRGWTDDLDLLATDREKELFSNLQEDAERELFVQEFWQARDPFPQSSRNELREEWESRLVEASRRWQGPGDDRSRVFLLRGEPASISEVRCPTSGTFEIWTYEPGFRKKYRVILLFFLMDGRTGGGPARLWRPGSSPDPVEAAAEPCSTPRLWQDAEWIRLQGRDQYAALIDWALARPRPREWISTFRPVPRVAPSAAAPSAAPELAPLLAEAEAALSAPRPRLHLRPPPDPLLIGRVRIPVQVEQAPEAPPDERVERVAFTLDGKPLLTRNRDVEPAGDAPVRVVTLIDCSSSMAAQIGQARQAALGFLRNLLRPQDQAAVIAFNSAPHVMVPLTGDLGQLEEGLQGILAEGDTALYDSLVVALLSLAQAKGQRAVLLLSDGADSTSRLGFEQTLAVARQQGIAVYTIGLGPPDGEARSKLTRLAEVTGGRSFFAGGAAELAGVYEQIETELRAQVKIPYQSSHNETDGAFRTVQVRVAKSGMEARTISGYYP